MFYFRTMPRTLQAPVTVAFDYTRSTGPVIGRFLTGLRDGVIVAGRTSDGEPGRATAAVAEPGAAAHGGARPLLGFGARLPRSTHFGR